ncbi:unnamed protein product [Nyctereutes procyonoides]|uniref:(raccoon dog) hypothetical protein n=1 Tax=Nyctereutes procyonoides TaxID=34880 RepID=A0A811Y1B3_NYCPR|nr:unnamed protein product [Nyctereutes procyonoides]
MLLLQVQGGYHELKRKPKYILEPPPCRSDPGNCTQFCTIQEDCKNGLQCCSAFCGIVCSLNKNINYDR